MEDLDGEKSELLGRLLLFDDWSEDLLSDALFGKQVERVLSPRERLVLSLKCEGKSDEYVLKVLNHRPMQVWVTLPTLQRMKRKIKQKLREGFIQELPGWVRGKVWETDDIREDDDPYENGQSLFKPI